MSHDLMEGTADGYRFIERTETGELSAWHALGKAYMGEKKASEAIKETSDGVTVELVPSVVEIDGGIIQVPGRSQIMMMNNGERTFFDQVSTDRYHIVNYEDFGALFDNLCSVYPVETCGLLNTGTMFISFRGDEFDIKGSDPHQMYYGANMSVIPKEASMFMYTPVRKVCRNTNILAIQQAQRKIAIGHTEDQLEWMKVATELLSDINKVNGVIIEVFEHLANTPTNQEFVDSVVKQVFSEPKLPNKLKLANERGIDNLSDDAKKTVERLTKTYESQVRTQQKLQQLALTEWERFNDDTVNKPIVNTMYGLYNVFTKLADHRVGNRGRAMDPASVLYGPRAMEKENAFKLIYNEAK